VSSFEVSTAAAREVATIANTAPPTDQRLSHLCATAQRVAEAVDEGDLADRGAPQGVAG
jgi:hypothetical protein